MRKFSRLAAITIPFLITLLLGVAMAQIIHPQPRFETPLEHLTADSDGVETLPLSTTAVYSIYLPIMVDPPLNPKKGFGAKAKPACDDLERLNASWYFNWRAWPDSTCGLDELEKFVPRIYNTDSMAFLSEAIDNAQASGWLIGFSEPNLPWQGNMTPKQGATLWRQIENAALPKGIKLVSPSPNQWEPGQNGYPYGHQWTWYMVSEYQALYGTKPHFDALGWNIYKSKASDIKAYLNARRGEALDRGYNVPFWLLEYGGDCGSSVDQIQSTMENTNPWLDSTPWIGRYAWFANRITTLDSDGVDNSKCSLVNSATGDLTKLGFTYRGY
ncbi:MAG: hypothetical protein KDJ97_06020 [Anaerolineae bacterium]|nr:hypothetical protein [Anaerolineae bacterium]